MLKWNATITEKHGQNIKNNALADEHSHKLSISVEGDKNSLEKIRSLCADQITSAGGQELISGFFEEIENIKETPEAITVE